LSTSKIFGKLFVKIYTPDKQIHAVPPILLHGMWTWSICFQSWVAWLVNNGYKVILIDLPGHGGSMTHKPPGKYSVADYVSDVWETLIALGEKEVHFLGHSMGGLILQHLLQKQAEELQTPIITKAILLMSAPPAWIRLRGSVLKTLSKLRYSLPILLCRTFCPTKEDALKHVLNTQSLVGQRTKIHAQFIGESGRAARDIIFWRSAVSGNIIRESSVSILVVAGTEDALLLEKVQFNIYLKYKGPRTTFVTLTSGHMPMHGSDSITNLKKILKWLQQ